jgi:cupin 2 domain-containing protein
LRTADPPPAIERGNLFADVPLTPLASERFDVLLRRPDLRLERIVSTGLVTPASEWYDQAEDEWVVVLSGAARLRIEGEPELLELGPGDYVLLPAHVRHRVEWSDPRGATVWLALHATAR